MKSSTRAKDLSEAISDRLHVKSPEGFSLFVKFAEKVVSIPEGDFFLDFIRNIDERIRKGKILPDGMAGVITMTVKVKMSINVHRL